MYYFVTTSTTDEFAPEYTTKFFKTREVLNEYLCSLEDCEVCSIGEVNETEDYMLAFFGRKF